MIIVFGNQKGGCGKTTNSIQFANYLSEKGKDVLVLDLDFQQSIYDRRKEDVATFDNEPSYEVIRAEISKVADLLQDFSNTQDSGNLIIDLPGKIDDNSLGTILGLADIIICPFRYDKLTMDSTGFFIQILRHLKVKAKLFFLPNNIRKSVRYETKEQILNILNQFGTVTAEVPERAAMERVNTLVINDECKKIVQDAYDCIITEGNII